MQVNKSHKTINDNINDVICFVAEKMTSLFVVGIFQEGFPDIFEEFGSEDELNMLMVWNSTILVSINHISEDKEIDYQSQIFQIIFNKKLES